MKIPARFVLFPCLLIAAVLPAAMADVPLRPLPPELLAIIDDNEALVEHGLQFATGVGVNGNIEIELISGNRRLREELHDGTLTPEQLQGDYMAALDEEVVYAEVRKAVRKLLQEMLRRSGGQTVIISGSVDTDADQLAEAEYRLGLKRYEDGKYHEAITSFQRAAARGYPRALRTIGFMHENGQGVERDREAGRKWYQRAAGEGEGEAFYNLGRMASADKNYTEALAYYQKAIERSPELSMAYNNVGFILNEMLHHEKAIPFLRKAIELNPEYAGSYSNLGISLDNLNRHEEAVRVYREALTLNPDAADVRVNLGVTLMRQDQYDAATKEFFRAIHLQPGWHQPYSGLGNIYFEKENFDLAVTAYRQLVKNRPDHPWGFKLLAESYAKLGDFDRAREAASQALDRVKTMPDYDAKATKEIEQAYQDYLAAGRSAASS